MRSRMKLDCCDNKNHSSDLNRIVDNAERASDFLKAVAHESRMIILFALAGGEKSVTELEQILSLRQPTVSQQLARLRAGGLVSTRRDGKVIFYNLASDESRVLIGTIYEVFCRKQRKRKLAATSITT